MILEKQASSSNGLFMLVVLIAVSLASIYGIVLGARMDSAMLAVASVLVLVAGCIGFNGLFIVEPNISIVLILFGDYIGSERRSGFWWTNPFATKRKLSLRVRNFESNKLKVNDHDGNPIEIAAVVVWRVVDSAEAMFEVDDYNNFIHVQSEAALRNLATSHPYDAHEDDQMSLRGNTGEVAADLKKEIQGRLQKAGVEVIEARISHLAYAAEIASAMLRRQQASAVISARSKIVEGAVTMVQMALEELSKRDVVHLDEERKAAMVSNLLVVLCSESETQPIINTGTLYQ